MDRGCGNAQVQDVHPSLVQQGVIARNDVRFVKKRVRQTVDGSGLEFKEVKVREALVRQRSGPVMKSS